MTNSKWLALLAAFGLAFSMAACGDDDELTSCASSEDCADDESCDTECGFCFLTDGQCVSDTECAEGETCQLLAEGCNATVCKTGEGPGPIACTPETFDVCYDEGLWCDDLVSECADLDVGTCSAATGKEAPAANGPMIYYVEKIGDCVANDDVHCTPADISCKFGVYFWDPEGDFDAEYADVKYVNPAGSVIAIGFVDAATIDGNFGAVPVYVCGSEAPPGAVLVQDNAGNQSNAVCL